MCVCAATMFDGTRDVARRQWTPFQDDVGQELGERVTRLDFAVGRD